MMLKYNLVLFEHKSGVQSLRHLIQRHQLRTIFTNLVNMLRFSEK